MPIADVLLLLLSTSVVASIFASAPVPDEARLPLIAHVLLLAGLSVAMTALAGAGYGIVTATSLLLITASYHPSLHGARYVRLVEPEGDLRTAVTGAAILFVIALAVLSVPSSGRRGSADEIQ